MDIAAVGTVTSKTQAATAKFSDTIINGFADRTVYRVTYDTPNYSIYLNALSGDQFAANGKPSFQSKDTFVGTIWYGPVD